MKVQFYIDGRQFETAEVYHTGKDLKMLANIPLSTDLYLSLPRPYEDEIIHNEQQIDLSRPATAYFYIRRPFEFVINNTTCKWHKQYISAEELRKIGMIDPEQEVYIQAGQPAGELVTNDVRIDLAQPGLERFFSKKKETDYTFIVNGRGKQWNKERISFDEAVVLAFGKLDQSQSRAYTITYSRGMEPKPEGIMVKENEIRVKDKMIFNVTATDKS